MGCNRPNRVILESERSLLIIHPLLHHRDRSESPSKSKRKAEKAARRREEELQAARQVAELSMYSAEDNPFHDANLGQQFDWRKKRDKEKKAGISDVEAARRDQVRRLEAKVRFS